MQRDSARCPKIICLPEDVAAQISSSTAIPSLTSVVVGLLENSLDAGAREIDIEVDFRKASCAVEDDGAGIAPQEFTKEGGLGKRFYTSKYKSIGELYGIQGTFLASVAALSILSVTSRQCNSVLQSTLVLHHSRPAARFLKSSTHNPPLIHGHGTRVVVRDLFGNMPVRVKQRTTATLEDSKYETKEFAHLRKSITAILLSFHKPVHVVLHQAEDGGSTRKILIGAKPERGSAVGFDSSDPSIQVPLLCKVLTHTGCLDPSEWDTWVKTSARTLNITIRGAISLQPAPSKHVQFMSLGKRPLDPEGGHNILYEEVNRLFALSSFGNQEEIPDKVDPKRSKDRRYKLDSPTKRQLKGRGKGVDRWPMFYIRVDLGEQNDTKKLEREATLNNVLKILGAMIHGFLTNNHFRPHALVKSKRLIPVSRSKMSSLGSATIPGDPFSGWSRIKSSARAESCTLTHPKADARIEYSTPVVNVSTAVDKEGENARPRSSAGEDLLKWTNPISKATVFINSRTGLAVPRPTPENRPATAPAELQRPNTASRLSRINSRPSIAPRRGSWADNLFSKWENPVFAPPAEEPIPQAFFDSPHLDIFRTFRDHASNTNTSKAFAESASSLSTRISKASLQSAHVIAQVDRKFILILVSTPETPNLLALVDQHAADERIRVEALLHDLHTQTPVPVTKPLVFDIPTREYSLFTTHAPLFARWGITYNLPPSATTSTTPTPTPSATHHLSILTLPPSIFSRCQSDPPLLLALLRTEIWSTSSSVPPTPSSTPPQGITNLLSSRACRSAIMFNDPLTVTEARTLVARLAGTERPWVCAHGRPSLVPVGDVGGGDGGCVGETGLGLGLLGWGRKGGRDDGLGDREDEVVSFQEGWRMWKVGRDGDGGGGGGQ